MTEFDLPEMSHPCVIDSWLQCNGNNGNDGCWMSLSTAQCAANRLTANKHTHTHIQIRTRARAHTHTQTNKHTHTHTHTHTQTTNKQTHAHTHPTWSAPWSTGSHCHAPLVAPKERDLHAVWASWGSEDTTGQLLHSPRSENPQRMTICIDDWLTDDHFYNYSTVHWDLKIPEEWPQYVDWLMMMMSWCLMSSDVIWHIRDKLWPMPKHGSIKSTYVRCMRV